MATIPFTENRLQGLMREVEQAINDCDDPMTLWRLSCALRLLSQEARGRKFQLDAERFTA